MEPELRKRCYVGSAPVLREPLAVCEAKSVAEEDLIVYELHYADRVGENFRRRRGGGDASTDPCDDAFARFSRSFSEKSVQTKFLK